MNMAHFKTLSIEEQADLYIPSGPGSFSELLKEFREGVIEFNEIISPSEIVDAEMEFHEWHLRRGRTIKEMDEWVVKMETIDRYDKESNGYKGFRNKLYNDPDYIKWSDKYCSDNGIKPRKSKDTVNRVLLAGDSWWNWKVGNKRDHTGTLDKTKHEFLNPCFHYFKNIYDKNKKNEEKNKRKRKKIG